MDKLSDADKRQQERIQALKDAEDKVMKLIESSLSTELLQAIMYQYLHRTEMNLSRAQSIIRKQQ
jgi:hypothetical protein